MKMRCCAFLYLLLQVLGGLGLPLFELSSKADDALQIALNEINAHYTRIHLYRVSKASVTKSEAGCYMRVRTTQQSTRIIALRCTKADSSSSESSEEGRLASYINLNHFGFTDRTHSTTSPSIHLGPPTHEGHHDNREINHVRGDHFNNHLPYH